MEQKLQMLKAGLSRMDICLSDAVCDRLIWYLEEMLRWNRRINLTAIRAFDEALEKHLLDSLTLLPLLNGQEKMLDMGSGAGLPSIPLKIAAPGLEILSVDSVHKKVAFQKHVARTLGFSGFEATPRRLEKLSEDNLYREAFSVVTARALTQMEHLIPLAKPFLAPGGRLLAFKGPEAEKELADCAAIADGDLLEVEKIHRIHLPFSGSERNLIIIRRSLQAL